MLSRQRWHQMLLCHYWSTPHCFLWVCCLWSCQVVSGSGLSLFRARKRPLFPSAWSEGKASTRPVCLVALTSPFPCSSHWLLGPPGSLLCHAKGPHSPGSSLSKFSCSWSLAEWKGLGAPSPIPSPLVTSCQQGCEVLSACWCCRLATCLFSKVHLNVLLRFSACEKK